MDIDHFVWFGRWLADQRQRHGYTTQEFAAQCGIKRPTISALESWARRGSHPSVGIVTRIAQGLDLPLLAVAVAAGGFERTDDVIADESLLAVLPVLRHLTPEVRSRQWSVWGAQYLRAVAADTSEGTIADRWTQLTEGSKALTQDWALVLNHGLISAWTTLDQVPGPALWAVVDAVGGDAVDVAGLTLLLGRVGPTAARRWGLSADYAAWVEIVADQGWGADFERFDAVAYRQAMRAVDWVRGAPGPVVAPPPGSDPDDLARRIAALTESDRAIIDTIVRRLEQR